MNKILFYTLYISAYTGISACNKINMNKMHQEEPSTSETDEKAPSPKNQKEKIKKQRKNFLRQ